jgi:GT2 family glycosyltransferase
VNQPLTRWNGSIDRVPASEPDEYPDVTVVIPHYRQASQLRLALCALDYQDYPVSGLQVVVADDGSPNEADLHRLGKYKFDLQVVRQEHRGFGLARARNLGAATAEGTQLVFLDADMVPERSFVNAHVRAMSGADYLVSIGDRRHVRPGLDVKVLAEHLANGGTIASIYQHAAVREPVWRREHLQRWDDLSADHAESYRVASGGNLALHKRFYHDVGGNDGSFRQWGGEDLEFAFRATQWGALFRFNRDAMAWHQGEEATTGPEERRSQEEQLPLLTNKIATPYLRKRLGPRVYEVPHLMVGIQWGKGLEQTTQLLIDMLLGHPMGAAIRVFDVHDGRAQRILERAYAHDPRVIVGPEAGVPAEITGNSAIPVRSLIFRSGAVTADSLLRAAELLESAQPRPAVVEIRHRGEAPTCAWVWSASAVARARRCANTDESFGELLARTSAIMGKIDYVLGEAPMRGTHRQESGRQLEVIEERLRQWYWNLSPRKKRLLLGIFGLASRRTRE